MSEEEAIFDDQVDLTSYCLLEFVEIKYPFVESSIHTRVIRSPPLHPFKTQGKIKNRPMTLS